MLQLTLRTLRHNATRLLLSSLAIVLGIGFVTGTLMFSDGLDAATEHRVGRLDRNIDVELTRDPDARPDAEDTSTEPEVGLHASMVDTVSKVPGVAVAEGSFVWHGVGLLGPDGRPVPGFHLVHTIAADQRLHGFDLTAGRLPHSSGEVVLDARTAARRDISVGAEVRARTGDRPLLTFQVVGLADLAGSSIDYGDGMLGMSLADAARLTGRTDVDRIIVVAAPGVDQAELAERVAGAAGPTAITRTGAQV
jgi:putative ABC transport system permease protein